MKNYYEGTIASNDYFVQRLEDEEILSIKLPKGKIHWENVNPEDLYKEDLKEDLEDEMDDILKGKEV